MTREERQLLLKDLSARLPYYTELYSNVADGNWAILTPVVISNLMNATDELVIKPYLRPMESMTADEEREFLSLGSGLAYKHKQVIYNTDQIDWLLKNHFDFRGLIEKGLALEATKDIYKED